MTVAMFESDFSDIRFGPFNIIQNNSRYDTVSFSMRTCAEYFHLENIISTRSSWLNCALRDDEAVYWVSIGHYEAVAVGN